MNNRSRCSELSHESKQSKIIDINDNMFSRFGKFTSSRFAIRKKAKKLNNPQYKFIPHYKKHENLDYLVKGNKLEKDLISIFDTKDINGSSKTKKDGKGLKIGKNKNIKNKLPRSRINNMSACFKSQDRSCLEIKRICKIKIPPCGHYNPNFQYRYPKSTKICFSSHKYKEGNLNANRFNFNFLQVNSLTKNIDYNESKEDLKSRISFKTMIPREKPVKSVRDTWSPTAIPSVSTSVVSPRLIDFSKYTERKNLYNHNSMIEDKYTPQYDKFLIPRLNKIGVQFQKMSTRETSLNGMLHNLKKVSINFSKLTSDQINEKMGLLSTSRKVKTPNFKKIRSRGNHFSKLPSYMQNMNGRINLNIVNNQPTFLNDSTDNAAQGFHLTYDLLSSVKRIKPKLYNCFSTEYSKEMLRKREGLITFKMNSKLLKINPKILIPHV